MFIPQQLVAKMQHKCNFYPQSEMEKLAFRKVELSNYTHISKRLKREFRESSRCKEQVLLSVLLKNNHSLFEFRRVMVPSGIINYE